MPFAYIYPLVHVAQVCSSVQNQDSTVIVDYASGLQALLYLRGREDAADWKGQYHRVTPPHQGGKPVSAEEELLRAGGIGFIPNFGPFAEQKAAALSKLYEEGAVAQFNETASAAAASASNPPHIRDLIASAISRIGAREARPMPWSRCAPPPCLAHRLILHNGRRMARAFTNRGSRSQD